MLPITPGTHNSFQRKPWDSNPQADVPPAVFKTASSSGRMTSVASCGSWNRTNGLLVQSQASLPAATTPQYLSNSDTGCRSKFAGKHSVRESHPICELQRLTPRLRAGESALRESNPPRQVGSLEPLPLGQEHVLLQAEGEGVEPVKALACARPLSRRLPSPVGLPFRLAAEAGIEPASRRLTAAFPYQHEHHRRRVES